MNLPGKALLSTHDDWPPGALQELLINCVAYDDHGEQSKLSCSATGQHQHC